MLNAFPGLILSSCTARFGKVWRIRVTNIGASCTFAATHPLAHKPFLGKLLHFSVPISRRQIQNLPYNRGDSAL